jgi:hypothetical protein
MDTKLHTIFGPMIFKMLTIMIVVSMDVQISLDVQDLEINNIAF